MTAIAPEAAARIRAITALLGPDIARKARQDALWPAEANGCACPWTFRRDPDRWERNPGATCGKHTIGELMAREVS